MKDILKLAFLFVYCFFAVIFSFILYKFFGLDAGLSIVLCIGLIIIFSKVILYLGICDKQISLLRGKVFLLVSGKNPFNNLKIGKNVTIKNRKCIVLGKNVTIDHDTEIYPVKKFNGVNYPSNIIIGDNVKIGAFNRYACCEKIIIEDNAGMAAYVHITDHSHDYRDVNTHFLKQGLIHKGPVIIGEGSWIGLRCSILTGVTIGKNSIVGAGSIVTHDVPPYSVVAGAPAKIVKRYDFELKEWVKV